MAADRMYVELSTADVELRTVRVSRYANVNDVAGVEDDQLPHREVAVRAGDVCRDRGLLNPIHIDGSLIGREPARNEGDVEPDYEHAPDPGCKDYIIG